MNNQKWTLAKHLKVCITNPKKGWAGTKILFKVYMICFMVYVYVGTKRMARVMFGDRDG